MLVGYYLPGNSPAPPPEPRAGGSTAHEEVQQSQFDPFPPGRCSGGAGSIFCQLKAVWHLLPPERCLGGANHVFYKPLLTFLREAAPFTNFHLNWWRFSVHSLHTHLLNQWYYWAHHSLVWWQQTSAVCCQTQLIHHQLLKQSRGILFSSQLFQINLCSCWCTTPIHLNMCP